MPTTVKFEEDYNESRKMEFTDESVKQTIVGHIWGDFIDEAAINLIGLVDDDVVMLRYLYEYIPLFYIIPMYNGFETVLTLQGIQTHRVNETTWKFSLDYGIPNNGGKSGGGLGTDQIGDVGPDAGENGGAGWTENFTQVSCNITPVTRNRQHSLRVLACQRNTNTAPNGVPYEVGKPAPIGHTQEGVQGIDVYEGQFQFNVTAYFPPEKLKYAYVRKLKLLHTRINENVWFGFPPGSCMFLEANFSGDLHQVVPVTFGFEVRNNFKFSQTGPSKFADPAIDDHTLMYDTIYEPFFEDTEIMPGWSDVDYTYAPIADNTVKATFQQPLFRTIHFNYFYANFEEFEL